MSDQYPDGAYIYTEHPIEVSVKDDFLCRAGGAYRPLEDALASGTLRPITDAQIDDSIYVPGEWHCPMCSFRLHSRVLYAQTGDVGVNRKQAEPCPNDGTEMQPLTWKQDAEEANRAALGLLKENRKLRERLDELEIRH